MILHRRKFLVTAAAVPVTPLLAAPLLGGGCKPAPPKTPLAHLYGEQWVHGAYELYAGGYRDVQSGAEQQSFDTYRVLAQKGITSLDALQSRGVPFYARVHGNGEDFAIERKVPERLTFTADMSEKQREEATANWNVAREHLHTDYEEVRRLNLALTTLLQQTQRVRNAIEGARIEQYQIVRKLDALAQGGATPFALPYQVSAKDYEGVLMLLLERLDDDAARLRAMEASIVSVGLVARSTDANSGSLADNLGQVLLAVVEDADASKPRAASYPKAEDERGALSSRGEKLRDGIRGSAEYKGWLKAERDKEFEQIGSLLTVLDKMTGLPVSSIYKQVLDIWSGDADYLSYLKTLASFIPGGSHVAKVVSQGIELTLKARDVTKTIAEGGGPDAILALAKKKGLGVLNTQSKYATDRINRQLTMFKAPRELEEARAALANSPLYKGPLPALPAMPSKPG